MALSKNILRKVCHIGTWHISMSALLACFLGFVLGFEWSALWWFCQSGWSMEGGGDNTTKEKGMAVLSLKGGGGSWKVNLEREESVEVDDLYVMGSFLTTKVIQFQAMKLTLINLWHPYGGVRISNLVDKHFLFRFYYEIDFDRFLEGSSWTFNGHLLVFHKLRKGEDSMVVSLVFVDFWVQIHDLPLRLITDNMAR